MKKLFSVSLLTVTCLYGLLVALAVGISLACGVSILPALIGGIIVLLLQFLISPWLMDLTTRWLYKADFNKEVPAYLKKFIEEVCEKNKIKYPRIGIIDDGAPNCYTYGRTKKDARIIITRGVFDLLSEEEVKAVIGHELGHVAHYDMLVMTVAQLIPIVFYAISACGKRGGGIIGIRCYNSNCFYFTVRICISFLYIIVVDDNNYAVLTGILAFIFKSYFGLFLRFL